MTLRALGCVIALAAAAPAVAQQPDPRWQLSLSGVWTGPSSLGSQAATETPNQAGATRYTLFETRTEMRAGAGVAGRLTCWLTRTIGAEAGASWSRPRLVTSISGDAEGAPGATAVSDVSVFTFDGSAVIRWSGMAPAGGRVVPFALAGAGYLRELYVGRTLVETGRLYHAGGGVLLWFQPLHAGWIRRVGGRVDARWTRAAGGITLGGRGGRSFATLSGGATLLF